MAVLRTVTISGREIVVEVEPASLPHMPLRGDEFPEGAEPTNFQERLKDASLLIDNTITGICSVVVKALQDLAPNEFSVEIGLTFKGENQPIPVLVKVGSEASIKVTASWNKAKE